MHHPRITAYKIARAHHSALESLEEKVEQGWEPYGEPWMKESSGVIFQPLVKYERGDDTIGPELIVETLRSLIDKVERLEQKLDGLQ